MLAWLELERQGLVDRAELCSLDAEPQVRGAGLAYRFKARELPYQDVLLLMIAVSDNLCTNLVIERMGMRRAQEVIRDGLGLEDTVLGRKLMDFDARRQGRDNWISPADCIRLFDRIAELPAPERAWIDSVLRSCQDDYLLLRDLPLDTITFHHKTGSIPGVMHDWGYTKDRRIFLLTQGEQDTPGLLSIFGELGQYLMDDGENKE